MMISFMLNQSALIAVAASAAVGFVLCLIMHSFCPCKQCCEKSMECDKNGGCCGKNGCEPHHHSSELVAHLCCKIGKFVVLFVQAYGLAFILQRLGVLASYGDSIALALFLGVTFIVSHIFLAVVKHKRSLVWFISKSVHILVVLVAMAAVLVYMASR